MDLDFIDSDKYLVTKSIKQIKYQNQLIIIDKKTGKYEILYFWFHKYKKYQDFIPDSKAYQRLFLLKTSIPNTNNLKHPTFLKLKDYKIIDNNNNEIGCYLITKYPINGCLNTLTDEYLQTKGKHHDKMNPTIRSKIIFGIASAMSYLHTKCITNNNISLEYIYLDENFEPKIINDCLTKSLNSIHEKDPLYFRPLKSNINRSHNINSERDKSIDIYSFGSFVYSLFSNNLNISKKKPDLMPDCYWKLVSKCWNQSFDERPTFKEIVENLQNDEFVIEEFNMKTDLDDLHEYQQKLQKFMQMEENAHNLDRG